MKNEIKNAVGSHGKWKGRLKKAIETGKIDARLSTIKADTECDFGKWLYGLTAEEKEEHLNNYQKVQQLHAAFHEEASRVVQLVQAGNKAGAMRMLDVNGGFTVASRDLTTAMLDWFTEMK
ncbi:MAG TPA: CZB domain-containing protein [Nitrospirota bacterium]